MLIPERTCSYSSRALKETRERSVHRPRPCCCCNFFPFGSKPRRVLPAPSSGLGFPSPPSLAVFLLRSNNTIQPFRSLWINFHSAYLALFSSLSRALRPSLHPRHLFPFPSPSSSCSSLLILHFSRCSPFPFPLTPSLIPLSFSRLSRSSFIPFIISPCPPFLAFPHNAHASTPEPTERLSPRHHDSISPSFLSVSLPLIIRLPPPPSALAVRPLVPFSPASPASGDLNWPRLPATAAKAARAASSLPCQAPTPGPWTLAF